LCFKDQFDPITEDPVRDSLDGKSDQPDSSKDDDHQHATDDEVIKINYFRL